MTPYTDIEVTDKYIIREFNENIDPIELLWHRDNEQRLVEIIGETDWKIQLDNQLPTSMNEPILIERHEWHRILKHHKNSVKIVHVLRPVGVATAGENELDPYKD